jgi:hypothetical protein
VQAAVPCGFARLDPMIRRNPKRPWTQSHLDFEQCRKKEFLNETRRSRRDQNWHKMTAECKTLFAQGVAAALCQVLCRASGCAGRVWYPVDLSGNHLATKVFWVKTISPILSHCVCVSLCRLLTDCSTCSKVFKRERCFLGKGTGCLIHVWLSCVILVCRCCGCDIVFSLFAWTPKLPGIVDQRGSVQPPSYHPAQPNLCKV